MMKTIMITAILLMLLLNSNHIVSADFMSKIKSARIPWRRNSPNNNAAASPGITQEQATVPTINGNNDNINNNNITSSFITMNWMKHFRQTDNDFHYKFEIGQSLLDQLFDVTLIHLLADTITHKPLPIDQTAFMENNEKLELSNLMIKRVRLLEFENTDKISIETSEDGDDTLNRKSMKQRMISKLKKMKAKMKSLFKTKKTDDESDNTASEGSILQAEGVVSPSFRVRLKQDSIKVIVKGLNLDLAADYKLKTRLTKHQGNLHIRAINSAMVFEIKSGQSPKTGHPVLILKEKPRIFLGRVSLRFGNSNGERKQLSRFSTAFVQKLGNSIVRFAIAVVHKRVPALTEKLASDLETRVLQESNSFFERLGFQIPTKPYFSINDLKFDVRASKLMITCGFNHLEENRPYFFRGEPDENDIEYNALA